MQQKEKKRDRALLLSLLLLLLVIGTAVYYYIYPYEGNRTVVKHLPAEKPVILYTQDTLAMDTTATATDSMALAVKTADTSAFGNIDTLLAITKPAVAEPVQPVENNLAEIEKLRDTRNLVNISTDDGIVCYYDAAKKHLSFYPTRAEWDKVYLIYPSPDAKSLLRRNLLFPDYEGMVYPIYRKGFMVYNGVKETAVAVKINAKADRKRSYVIQAKSNPQYFIFGDYEDKSKWYIYENGKVRKFDPPSDLDAGLTEKL